MTISLGLSVANQASNVASQGIASSLFGSAQAIVEYAEVARVNKEAATALARRINDLVTAVVSELEAVDRNLSPEWRRTLENFNELLTEVKSALQDQAKRGYLAQVLHKDRDAAALKQFAQRVKETFQVLMVTARIAMQQQLQVILSALDASALPKLDLTAGVDPVSRGASIPPAPQLHFGRAAETEDTVAILAHEGPSYAAILGGPGMGKTSLAVAVLHEPTVVARFGQRRYFVSCDAAEGQATCLGIVCATFGIASGSRKAAQKALAAALGEAPCLLVLDNFESAWEDVASRSEAEEVLAFMTSIPGLSLAITMRGSERPQGVPWTRPVLQPLQPLDRDASVQLFLSLSDVSEDNEDVLKLLDHLDAVPLAVVLAGNISQVESPKDVLARWEAMKTAMLQRGSGDHRLTSLDVSIELSLSSPRINEEPRAVTLLSLLSLLPQGVVDSDLRVWAPELCGRSLSVLLRTSLAQRNVGRVCVLAPIREYVLIHHPPSGESLMQLYAWYFGLADLMRQEGKGCSSPEAVATVSPEVDNILSVIRHGLEQPEALPAAVKAAARMSILLNTTGLGSFDLIPRAATVARAAQLDGLTADLLFEWGLWARDYGTGGDFKELIREAHALYKRAGDDIGTINSALRLADFLPAEEAVASCAETCAFAEGRAAPGVVARCHERLGYACERAGRLVEAASHLQQAAVILRALGPEAFRVLAFTVTRMAILSLYTGDVAGVVERSRESIALNQTAQHQVGVADARRVIGLVYLPQGNLRGAILETEQALAYYEVSGHVPLQMEALRVLLKTHLDSDNYQLANTVAEKADILYAAAGREWDPHNLAMLLQLKGELALWRGDLPDARAAFMGAASAARTRERIRLPVEEMIYIEAEQHELLGQVAQAEGDAHSALTSFLVAALIFRKQSAQLSTVPALSRLAQVLSDDAAEVLLGAVMLPLLRYGFRPMLGHALLHSASIARRRAQRSAARHRALRSIHHFEDTGYQRGLTRARAFLDNCT